MSDIKPTSDQASVADWLIDRIRAYDQVDPETVHLDSPLSELGLDSIYVLTLCGDIEDTYAVQIDPPFLAAFDTVRELAVGLSARIDSL